MKGLLLKDLYIAKSNIVVTLVGLLTIGFGLSSLMETSALLIIAPAVSTTAVFISITSDDNSKWNMNVITMPVTRAQIIGEKYLMYIILSLIGIVIAVIPCLVMGAFRNDVSLNSLVMYSTMGAGAAFLAGSISLLCAYLFDAEKSQIVFMMSYIGTSGIITSIVLVLNLFFPVKNHLTLTFGIVFVISLLAFAVSYLCSSNMYEKKDVN